MSLYSNLESVFGGVCVVHAPDLYPERAPYFKQHLQDLGVIQYSIVEAPKIPETDPRVMHFREDDSKVLRKLSHYDAMRACVRLAQKNQWETLLVLEDDFLPRWNFEKYWSKISNGVAAYDWDMFLFYRWHMVPILEIPIKIELRRIRFSFCTHGFALNQRFYDRYLETAKETLRHGASIDEKPFYESLMAQGIKVVAPSRNLLGQQSGFKSEISGATRGASRIDEFRIGSLLSIRWYGILVSYVVLNTIRYIKSSIGFRSLKR